METTAASSTPPAPPTPRRRAYDPGTLRDFEEIAPGMFAVRSFREDKWYRVNLAEGTCTCEAFARRPDQPCKHQRGLGVICRAARKGLRYLDGRIAEFGATGDAARLALAEAARQLVQTRAQAAVRRAMAQVRSRSYLPV